MTTKYKAPDKTHATISPDEASEQTNAVSEAFIDQVDQRKSLVDGEVKKLLDEEEEGGGQEGPEPTRYGDWEKAGRCTDF